MIADSRSSRLPLAEQMPPVLRDFESGPLEFGELGDQASNYTGLADAAGMAADYDDGHGAVASRQPLVSSHSLTAVVVG
jgi:hypothetical protein